MNNIHGVVFISGDLHLGAIDNGAHAGFPEMCVATPNIELETRCSTDAPGDWSEGFYDDTCTGYGLVTILTNPDRLILQAADQDGNIHISYTVLTENQPIDSDNHRRAKGRETMAYRHPY